MRILFLTYHGFEEASGISKKMLAQIKGLRQNGHEVHLCYYDIAADGSRCRYVDGKIIHNYGRGRLSTLLQRMDYRCINDYCRKHAIQLVYVRCFMNASPFNIRLFKNLQADGIKSVMEVPTYPYDGEFSSLPLKYRLEHIFDKLFRCKLAYYMDAIVTFTDEKEIFGQRTICISNGVDFDSIPLHKPVAVTNVVHLIGVAEVHPWHGFDRLIKGLGEYYCQKTKASSNKPDVFFHVIGGVSESMMRDFQDIIHQFGIEKYVVFHGKLFGDELTAVFNQCQFAIGSLARHRSGITRIKTLKNREYAARGIPFIYSEEDSDFDQQPYVMKATADESPIDIQSILGFYGCLVLTPAEIRQTVTQLSWKVQMQRVINQIS
jgi:glycosyltransferase involved in cell wall biosynthesis